MDDERYMQMVNNAVDAQVRRMCADAGQVTLGELHAWLSTAPPDAVVVLSTGGHPGELSSYRGYYDMIAIETGESCTASEFAERVGDAIGSTFTGYKGGEFAMTRMTPVWVSEYGDASDMGVTGVTVADGVVTLEVSNVEGD